MFLKLFFALIALVLFSIPARADNVLFGSVTFTGLQGFALRVQMDFSGTNFAVGGGAVSIINPHASCFLSNAPCLPGQVINVFASSEVFGTGDVSGGMTINGVPYSPITGGSIAGGGGTLTIPFTSDAEITLRSPFGEISGSFQGGGQNLGFFGNGASSTLVLGQDVVLHHYFFRSLTITFQTPEPSTVVLLITGLLGIVVFRRRSASIKPPQRM